MRIFILSVLFFISGMSSVYCQSADSLQDSVYSNADKSWGNDSLAVDPALETSGEDEGFTIVMGIMLLLVILAASGIGAALLTGGLLLMAGLIFVGVLSSSIIVGLYRKSFEKGFMVFIIGFPASVGVITGMAVFYILNEIMDWWSETTAIVSGGIVGCLSGALFGLLAYLILQKLTSFLLKYFNVKQS